MSLKNKINKLYIDARRIAVAEGRNQTLVPFITLFKYSEQNVTIPDTSNPYVCFTLNGVLRLHFYRGIFDYQPGQYVISTLDLPLSGQTMTVSLDSPFCALHIEFTIDEVIAVLLDMNADYLDIEVEETENTGIQPYADEMLLDILSRLLNITNQPEEQRFLAKHLKRELIFYLLTGPNNTQFKNSIIQSHKVGDIYGAINWMKRNYKRSFSMEELAKQSNMSVSAFYQNFKSVADMAPLQCQKKMRLMEARRLMLDEAMNVTEASIEVGYESLSQFNRDYRRLFGFPPLRDIHNISTYLQKNKQPE